MDIIAFVSTVAENPFLYDKFNPRHKDAKLTELKWELIGFEFGMSGDDAKKKFKGYREKYIREKNVGRASWYLMKHMSFLDKKHQPPEKHKKPNEQIKFTDLDFFRNNINEEKLDDTISQTAPTPTDTNIITEALEEALHTLEQETIKPKHVDEINNFCKYLASELSRLPRKHADDLKDTILQLLFSKLKNVRRTNIKCSK